MCIRDRISDAKGAEALCAYYAFYTLAMGRGEPRRFAQIAALLKEARFASVRLVETPLPTATSLIVAKAG